MIIKCLVCNLFSWLRNSLHAMYTFIFESCCRRNVGRQPEGRPLHGIIYLQHDLMYSFIGSIYFLRKDRFYPIDLSFTSVGMWGLFENMACENYFDLIR